ncbi:MAG: tripartite tricarboxylate transporter TctB family protein [Pelistega sp.]|nr:tripartite tricarboxylate transporter TctB family protein [Pelistega sp.]
MQDSRSNPVEHYQRASRPWWLALLVILAGGICLYSASDLSVTAQYAAVGPGLFLFGIGGLLCFFGFVLLVQIARGEQFEPQDTEDAQGHTPMDKKAFCITLLATFLPALTIEILGLALTATMCFTLVTYAFGSKKVLLNLFLGFLVGSISWGIFSYLGLQLGDFFPFLGA